MVVLVGEDDPQRPYPYFDLYWSEPESRWPYWLEASGATVGFALLCRDDESGRMQIAEFFIRPRHRRGRTGLVAARHLISRFPGPWRITQRERNSGAIAFWHAVLDGFVDYQETTTRTDAVRREQRFTIA